MSENPGQNPNVARDSSSHQVITSFVPAPERIGDTDSMRHPAAKASNENEVSNLEDEKTVISKPFAVVRNPVVTWHLEELEGAHFDHLHLKEYIGGGMSAVYRAVDESLSRTVAVKILPPELRTDEFLRRFRNEAKNSARLDHENIARVFYVGNHDELEYIVFEYVDGDNLRQLVEKIGPMSLDLAIRYTLQIAAALQHAFERNVTHRDVKPSNAIITKGGRVKLVDMGLARFQNESRRESDDLTATGITMGTFDYISPEQARDARSVDVRSDLYSLGCTLFFMLTGNPPYPDGTPIEKILQHSNSARPDPRVFRSDLPREMSAIVKKLLAPNPDHRYQTPNMLISDLLSLAARNDIPLYGFEHALAAPKQIAKSSAERLLPIVIPVFAIVSLLFIWEWIAPTPDIDRSRSSNNNSNRVVEETAGKPAVDSSENTAKQTGVSNSATDDTGNSQKKNLVESKDATNKAAGSKTVKPNPRGEVNAPTTTVEQIIIGQLEEQDVTASNAAVFATLDKALNEIRLAKFPEVRKIELHFNGEQVVSSLELDSKGNFEISAAEGFKPLVVFQPADSNDAKMIRLRGGNVTINNVHFRLECPKVGIVEGITLFDVRQLQMLELDGCSVTVVNSDDQNFMLQNDVAVFRIEPPMTPLTSGIRQIGGSPVLRMNNCIVRGNAALLKMSSSVPFVLRIDNGFVVTPQYILQMEGSDAAPDLFKSGEVYLNHVTCVSAGLARVNLSKAKPFHILLSLNCDSCIFKPVGTESALIEYVNLDQTINRKDVLRLKGENNFFSNTHPLWSLIDSGGTVPPIKIDIDQAVNEPDWFEQKVPDISSQVEMQSSKLAAAKPVHEQSIEDYYLTGGQTNPAVRKNAGFEKERMPAIPVGSISEKISPAPAAGDPAVDAAE